MNFRDHWETDSDGEKFIFTVEMQRALHNLGLPVEPGSLSRLADSHPLKPKKLVGVTRRPKPVVAAEPEAIQLDPMTGKFVGRMKYYNKLKGYGFIARGAGESIFFHRTQVIGDPEGFENGAWLLYEVMETARGQEAFEVELYDRELAAE